MDPGEKGQAAGCDGRSPENAILDGVQFDFTAGPPRLANAEHAEIIRRLAHSLAERMMVFGNWPRDAS